MILSFIAQKSASFAKLLTFYVLYGIMHIALEKQLQSLEKLKVGLR
jgi:hypothetical protein